jgi:tetratricopeptide (TPR) repeat protein
MAGSDELEKNLEELGRAIGSDEAFGETVMRRISGESTGRTEKPSISQTSVSRRRIVMNRFAKVAVAAAIFIGALLGIAFLRSAGSAAYAIGQTAQAMRQVRFMHMLHQDRAGNVVDERWIEIDHDGYQARYRQDTPPRHFLVVDDRQTVMVYHTSQDKNTVVLYDPNQKSFTWHYAPGRMFEEIAEGQPNYDVVAENVPYRGRLAHHLRSALLDTDVYIDPKTKLPMACGEYEISYEDPPPGTFDIVIPEGVIVVDKRPGAEPGPEPQWMVEERREKEIGEIAQAHFEQGRRALAGGDYERAMEELEEAIELSNGHRNWAWLWLGKALYAAGDYDAAIYRFTKVIDMIAEYDMVIPSYHYARALAYEAKGMTEMAILDLEKALPKMIQALRNPDAARSFDLADDPLIAADGMWEGCHDAPRAAQSVAMMINRLRRVTGQSFGYDPAATPAENEPAIAAWETWFSDPQREMRFTPDAPCVEVPAAAHPN